MDSELNHNDTKSTTLFHSLRWRVAAKRSPGQGSLRCALKLPIRGPLTMIFSINTGRDGHSEIANRAVCVSGHERLQKRNYEKLKRAKTQLFSSDSCSKFLIDFQN